MKDYMCITLETKQNTVFTLKVQFVSVAFVAPYNLPDHTKHCIHKVGRAQGDSPYPCSRLLATTSRATQVIRLINTGQS